MSTSITRALADTYFSTRLDNEVWDGFSIGDRDKAIQSGLDDVSVAYGGDITSATVSTSNNYYPDRAVYHQALFLLVNSDHTANGELTGPKWSGATTDGIVKDKSEGTISADSQRWLNWRSGSSISITRG